MKRVVSVSLGSSKRDETSHATILGQEFEMSRIGTDGDMKRYADMIVELDGKVDAIGLGGCDRYVWVDDRRYAFRDIDRIARLAKTTPVVDGSGVKNTLERQTIEHLQSGGMVDFTDKRVLVVCAVDRFGMAQTVAKLARQVVFGDLMFNVGVPLPLRSYGALRLVATTFLPIVTRLPFQWLYPTGKKQETSVPKYVNYYQWADVIAGDWHIIRRSMPTAESGALEGKVIITNTLTEEDMKILRDHKVRLVVTASPEYNGRRFGTNVFEGVLVTLMGRRPEEITPADYDALLAELKWQPTITELGVG